MTRALLRWLGLGFLLGASLLLAACGGEEPAPTPTATGTRAPTPAATTTRTPTAPAATGTLEVRVTDLPNPAITAIDITAEAVQVHLASQDQWITVVEGPVSFDLIQVAGVEEILGSGELSPGEYTQIRLTITSTTITEDGSKAEAQVPSETLRIVRPFTIVAGETTIATLDFDAEQSVIAQGRGRFLLKPVVKLLVRKGDEPFRPAGRSTATPTPTATATATATLTPTATPTPTVTPTPTATLAPTGQFFLYIESPQEVVPFHTSPTIDVVGRTRLDAAISINDTFVEVDEDGRFKTTVQLQKGTNIIEVVASLVTREEKSVVLTVIYEPQGG